MAKQLVVDLVFNANIANAQRQMKTLESSLKSLQGTVSRDIAGQGLTNNLERAQSVLVDLKANLASAFNVDTGRLDLTKFNAGLKKGKAELEQYRIILQGLGPKGQQAFNQLTQAIVAGEIPLRRTKNLLTTMIDTFGSSIKWSIAYGAINKISEGFSNAFQYAQDLNESLTNIRIVTGLSADEMNRFAEKANKAAKALATSTTAYTDAALIYYQQGLEGKAVEERAETTIKLANVTGESAETVSEWMTAVWNNFDDGSQKLEYYADVMAKLGAETASSADEIATGFEKFAAVADTVGLSYEYGASALATVTATTRQSAEVVGTAFKTLFARIQDLELGNTLDDGTTLGQYSEALNKVGINIKTTSGDLKDMDIILDEMGRTWDTLGNDQQVALAKSVAGIRQYTQLIALMDNYDYFKELTKSADSASGTLEEQQNIWAESWEAAEKRVQASAQDIYESLINDEFFIDLNNVFADLLTVVDGFIDALGGLRTLLPFIVGWLMKAFGPTALGMITSYTAQLRGVNSATASSAMGLKTAALEQQAVMSAKTGDAGIGYEGKALGVGADQQRKLAEAIENITRNVSKEEARQVESLAAKQREWAKILEIQGQYIDGLQREADLTNPEAYAADAKAANTDAELIKNKISNDILAMTPDNLQDAEKTKVDSAFATFDSTMEQAGKTQAAVELFNQDENFTDTASAKKAAEELQRTAGADLEQISKGTKDNLDKFIKDSTDLEAMEQKRGTAGFDQSKYDKLSRDTQGGMESLRRSFSRDNFDAVAEAKKTGLAQMGTDTGLGETNEDLVKYANLRQKATNAEKNATVTTTKHNKTVEELNGAQENYNKNVDESNEALEDSIKSAKQFNKAPLGQTIMGVAGSMGMLAGGLSSVVSGFEQFIEMGKSGEWTLSGVLGAITAMTMAFPMVISGLSGMNQALMETSLVQNLVQSATRKHMATLVEKAGIEKALQGIETAEQLSQKTGIALDQAEEILAQKKNGTLTKETLLTTLNTVSKTANNTTEEVGIGTKIAQTAATWAHNAALMAQNALMAPALILILAITAALVIIIGVIKLVTNAINADANAAKEAAVRAEQMAEQYNKVKEAYDNLKKSLEDYNAAQDAIEKLKEGTKEWRDAIQEANWQVLSLVKSYPELADLVENVNGRLIISEENQQKVLDAQAAQVSTVYNAKLDTQLEADKAANKSKHTNLIRDKLDTYDDGLILAAGISGMGVGAIFDSIAANQEAAEESEKAFDMLESKYEEIGDELFVKWDKATLQSYGLSEELATALYENKDSVQALIKSNHELAEREEMINRQKVDSYLTNAGFQGWNNYGDAVGDRATELYKREVDKIKNSGTSEAGNSLDIDDWARGESGSGFWEQFANSFGITTSAWQEGEDAFSEYAKIMGYTDAKSTDFKGNKIEFEYVGENNEVQEASVTYKQMQKTLAEHAVNQSDSIGDYVGSITNTIGELKYAAKFAESGTAESAGGALASFAETGNFDLVSPEQMQAMYDLGGPEGLIQKLGYSTEEMAEKLGYGADQTDKMLAEIYDAWQDYDPSEAMRNINIKLGQEIDALFESNTEALDTTTHALDMYAAHLVSTNDGLEDNKMLAAQASVANFKLAKGLNNLQKVLEENLEILADADTTSLNYYESLGKVKESIEETFGLEVSANFITSNLDKIQKMANGDVEALKELQQEIAQDFIVNLDLKDQDLKNTLSSKISELQEFAYNSEIGVNVTTDTEALTAGLNEALMTGQITVEEIESLFANMGYEPPEINYETVDVPTRTKTHTVLTKFDSNGNPSGTEEYDTEATTWTETKVPYLAGSKPAINDATGEVDTYATAGINLTTASNKDSLGSGLNYSEDPETKSDKKKRWKELDEEIERYHKIDETIENTERELDKLSKAKDRVFGKGKLDLMDQEIAKGKELLQNYKDRAVEVEEFYNQDRKYLLSNYKVHLDEEGNITNYNDLIQTQIDKLKSMNPEDEDYEKETEYLDQMKEDFAQYEETLDEFYDSQQKVIDQQHELWNLATEKITYEVEFNLEMNEDDMKYLDYLLSKIEDDAFAAAEAISHYGEQSNIIEENINITNKGIDDLITQIETEQGGVATDEQQQQIREYRDNLMDLELELRELATTVGDRLTEEWEAWNDDLDKNAEKLKHNSTIIESYRNIVDLIGQENLGIDDSLMLEMWEAQTKAANGTVAATKEALDVNKAYLAQLQEERAVAVDGSDEAKMWDEKIEEAQEKVNELEENLQSSLEEALQVAADKFAATMDQISKTFEKSVAGIYGSLEKLTEAFDRQKEINERYLEDYEKTYEISKLNRQIEQSIDKTQNVASQKQLRNLQDELLEMQKDGVNVSERDIGLMQKKYDLMLAEQALQDAQNAKSVVRLQRDSEGNYGYVYTADQIAVDSAQQTYEDKLYELQNYQKESEEIITEGYLSALEGFNDAMMVLQDTSGKYTEDQRQAAAENVEYYKGLIEYWTTEGNKLTQNNSAINQRYNTELADSFKKTFLGSINPDIEEWSGLFNNTIIAMEGYHTRLNTALDTYESEVKLHLEASGTSYTALKTKVKEEVKLINQDTQSVIDKAKELADKMDEHLNGDDGAIKAVDSFYTDYEEKIKNINEVTQSAIDKVQEFLNKWAEASGKDEEELKSPGPEETGTLSTNTTTALSLTPSDIDNTLTKYNVPEVQKKGFTPITLGDKTMNTNEIMEKVNSEYDANTDLGKKDWGGAGSDNINNYKSVYIVHTFDSNGNKLTKGDGWRIDNLKDTFGGASITGYKEVDKPGITHLYRVEGIKYDNGSIGTAYFNWTDLNEIFGWEILDPSKYYGDSFDTGGYTGQWGPEGRLAMLHQKEIVLNAQDTENFLSAIKIVRSMADQLEANALAARYGLAAFTASTINTPDNTLEQNVTIHAEFLSATNHSEIEEAFRNLNTLASQYANRKI